MRPYSLYLTFLAFSFFTYIQTNYASDLKNQILPNGSDGILTGESVAGAEGESLLDGVFAFARDSIFGLLFLIAIGMFLYIGFRLLIARGNPEEFKKALQSFIYAAVWLFVVAFAWALVRLVAGISI